MTARLITPAELIQAATGIDWATIAETPGASAALQTIEQQNLIDRASGFIANFCHQRLDATTDNEQDIVSGISTKTWIDGNGWLWLRTDYFPVLSVSAMSWAVLGGGVPTYNALTPANLWIQGGGGFRFNRIADYSQDWRFARIGPLGIKLTYVNGWPNAILNNSVTAGSNKTLNVDTTLGMTPTPGITGIGQTLTIYDGVNTEVVTVQSVTDGANFIVPTLQFAHAAGVRVSALPADIVEAMVLVCMEFARERGVDAIIMGGGQSSAKGMAEGDALPKAEYILEPFVRHV